MSGKYLVNSRLFQSKENTFGFHPKKNHDIFYLDYRIFPARVDQSKVGKVFPCLVLKVVYRGIGDHLGDRHDYDGLDVPGVGDGPNGGDDGYDDG